MRRIRWEVEQRPVLKHPYRDTALANCALTVLVVAIAVATGGGVVRSVLIAAGFFVAATAWSWWRWRERLGKPGGRR